MLPPTPGPVPPPLPAATPWPLPPLTRSRFGFEARVVLAAGGLIILLSITVVTLLDEVSMLLGEPDTVTVSDIA